ncbi:MAG: glycosyl hydrolase [Gemmatimonadaceae bacterium]|nr:glycosyl hydrolase [Gemmatimonadaceae bacterium]
MRLSVLLAAPLLCIPTVADVLAAQGRRAAPAAAPAPAAAFDSASLRALRWRNVGPSRGGRAVTVAGIPNQPLTYFAGFTGGGLWRTDNAGGSWRNISDGFFRTGSIGAIAVAPSDANVLYVGTGEHPIRGQSSSYGVGMYKSTDQGRTWKHIGLDATRQIAAVRVHPQNPDVIYVAAQGDRWKGSADRGVYRSTDGGATWTLVLKGLNEFSGANDLSMDATNPRILYAAFWDHQRVPWNVRSGGPGSGLWKSTDGGDTWTRLTEGLPSLMGKIGVSVSPANPDRVYAIVEAMRGGLYRSDDAGRSWRLLSEDRLIQTRSWYYMKVYADPQNADVVWVTNAPVLKSIDGGRTFAVVPATHGDNHSIWINPSDSRYMANANDGGASVSLDGGRSWSTQENQPTAQFYHVTVDDDFPYKLYSGQQDNSSVVIRSRGQGSIGSRDWWPTAGCESANIGVSARNPRYVFGGCYQGIINEIDHVTNLGRTIMAYPEMNLTEPTDKTKYRFNWTAPIVVSQHDDKVLYHGGNVLFRSTDRGQSWTNASPDLTKNDKTRQGWGGGPITNEGAGGEVYGTIFVIEESPHDAKTLYVGTDDGLVQLTRDGGATWTRVTPPVPDGLVNEIEVSPHDPGTVYVAFRTDRLGDPAPHVFKSTDFGKTWTRLVAGLRDGEPVRVVREDPVRAGLLYAGTETGVYVSTNGGQRWEPLPVRFPVVPVTDLEVRHGDLIASTEGRAFWILDDLSVLRQHAGAATTASAHLYQPRPTVVLEGDGGGFGGGGGPPGSGWRAGANPPSGARVFFRLAAAPDSATPVTIDVLDASGAVVRRVSTASRDSAQRYVARAGLNEWIWNLRREAPTTLRGIQLFGAPQGGGARVSAGTYTVRLTVGTQTLTTKLELLRDPRLDAPAEAVAARDAMANQLAMRIGEVHDAVVRVRDLKTQLSAAIARAADAPNVNAIRAAGRSVTAKLDGVEPQMTTKATNGQDIINYANGINGQIGFLLGQIEGNPVLTEGSRQRMGELEQQWTKLKAVLDAIERNDIPAFNKLLQDGKVDGVQVKGGKPAVM